MAQIRFDDGMWSYCLGPQMGGEESLPGREARSMLARWLLREPGRTQLRRYAELEVRVEARTDEALIERVCAAIEMRGLGLWRVERMGLVDASEAEVEAEALVESAQEDETHWIHVVVVDEEDQPLVGVKYRIELTDGRVREGQTDANGGLYFDEIPAGECPFWLVDYDERMWRLATDRVHRIARSLRIVEVEVRTTLGHAVVNVAATATFENGVVLRAHTNTDGIAKFVGAPRGIDGTITYEDENDLIARSFAANMNAAVNESDEKLTLQLLQSAVDFEAVDVAFQEVYGEALRASIESAFGEGNHASVFQYMLVQTELAGEATPAASEAGP